MNFFSQLDQQFWQSLVDNPWVIFINSLDVLLVAWLIYRFIKALAGTKIMSLVNGVILFLLLRFIAEIIGLKTITYLMNQVVTYGVIAAVVIFAPEIRSGLEKFGRTTKLLSAKSPLSDEEKLIYDLSQAISYMSPRKIGALIALERTQTLSEYVDTGIRLDAAISKELLINIFIPNTPLHDGAVMISDNKVVSACSYLPLSDSANISKEFGTRHRAAIGLSENSDAIVLVVSEETGAISIVHKGEFLHDLSITDFELIMTTLLIVPKRKPSYLQQFWKVVKGS